MSTTPYKQGDVVLVSVNYTDDLSKAKTRPAIILSHNKCPCGSKSGLILIAVSTSDNAEPCDYPLEGLTLTQSGLMYPSVVKTGFIFTMKPMNFIKKTGAIPTRELKKIAEKIVNHIWHGLTIP